MRKLLLGTVAVLALGTAKEAAADYAFGFSNFDVLQTLTLTFSDTSVASITAFNQGWWSTAETNNNGNLNYITGADGSSLQNNYFAFDLSNVRGTVVSATLDLFTYDIGGPVTYTNYDVSTPIAALINKADNPSLAIFNDLGSGIAYSAGTALDPSDSDMAMSFALNGAAVAAINGALGGNFAIGGTVTGPVTEVPAPTALALFGLGLVGLGVASRRR
jgi:hypothetical protein